MEALNFLPLLLTPDELEQITGRKLSKKQVEWLLTKHWQFEVNARGAPVVARSYAEARLSGINSTPQVARHRRPNFDAIRAAA
jgi:hypothetical protein